MSKGQKFLCLSFHNAPVSQTAIMKDQEIFGYHCRDRSNRCEIGTGLFNKRRIKNKFNYGKDLIRFPATGAERIGRDGDERGTAFMVNHCDRVLR